jgi:hypothetical protein
MADIEDDEPLFAKLSETDMSLLRAQNHLVDFMLTTHVSDRVRRMCEVEMEEGRKRGWKFESN